MSAVQWISVGIVGLFIVVFVLRHGWIDEEES